MARGRSIAASAIVLILLTVMIVSANASRDSRKFRIQFYRQSDIGDWRRVSITGKASIRNEVKSDGKIVDKYGVEAKIDFLGVDTVVEIGEDGQIVAKKLYVEKFFLIGKEMMYFSVVSNVVILAKWDGKNVVYTIDNKPVEKILEQWLWLIKWGPAPDSLKEDEIFGTSEMKRIGDTWGVNIDALVRVAMETGVTKVNKEDIEGRNKLTGVSTVGDVECLEIKRVLNIKDSVTQSNDGKYTQRVQTKLLATELLPINPFLPKLGRRENSGMTIVTTTGGGYEPLSETKVRISISLIWETLSWGSKGNGGATGG